MNVTLKQSVEIKREKKNALHIMKWNVNHCYMDYTANNEANNEEKNLK